MLSMFGNEFILIIISLIYFGCPVATQDANITIPLNTTITYDSREIYGGFLTLNGSSTVQVKFTDINKNLTFIVFQAHSHLYNITMYKNEKLPTSEISGTNLGLLSFMEPTVDTFYVVNTDPNVIVRAYIAVHGYIEMDPIPGGCNMEFPVPISPYLRTQTRSDYIFVDAAPPSTNPNCDPQSDDANMTFYMMYLPEMNYYADVYFDGIRKMMSFNSIKKYGQIIPESSWPITRRMLSAYPGTGAIYAVVATRHLETKVAYSVYAPNFSYGCSVLNEDGCEILVDMLSQVLCAVLLFVGAFVCFFGHRFFKTEMFLAGFFSGAIISYILIALITVVDNPALLPASVLSGVFFGAIWLLFWWLYGIPVIAVLLPSLNLGFLLAAIFYYRLPANIKYLELDFNFWSPFILVMLLTALAVVSVTYAANILCCAVLGAYATVLSIDYYLGSNLKFIIVNTIRRAVVPNFNKATLMPPFQWRDLSVTLIWVVLASLGFIFQHWHNRGRPPFPPPPRSVRPRMPEPVMYGSIVDYTRRQDYNPNAPPLDPTAYTERTALLA